ncbi:MAG: hypothetical protein R3B45_12710 [Bdellovibrionota bacterium]
MPEQKKSLASSTDGFSILGTIIAIALVGIGIKVMSQFSSNVIRLNRQFSKSAAYEEVEESIRSMINKGLRTYWAKECRTDGSGFALAFGPYNPINKLRNEYTALYGETNLKADIQQW